MEKKLAKGKGTFSSSSSSFDSVRRFVSRLCRRWPSSRTIRFVSGNCSPRMSSTRKKIFSRFDVETSDRKEGRRDFQFSETEQSDAIDRFQRSGRCRSVCSTSINSTSFSTFSSVSRCSTWIVNRTSDTLQNLTCQLATLVDLKLVEKVQSTTMAAHHLTKIKAKIKVTSTENGMIFGNIVDDVTGSQRRRVERH